MCVCVCMWIRISDTLHRIRTQQPCNWRHTNSDNDECSQRPVPVRADPLSGSVPIYRPLANSASVTQPEVKGNELFRLPLRKLCVHSTCRPIDMNNYYNRYTTTCFGPMYWPSSGCTLTCQATIQMGGFGCVCVCGGGVGGRDLVFITVGGIPLDIMTNVPLFHHGALP